MQTNTVIPPFLDLNLHSSPYGRTVRIWVVSQDAPGRYARGNVYSRETRWKTTTRLYLYTYNIFSCVYYMRCNMYIISQLQYQIGLHFIRFFLSFSNRVTVYFVFFFCFVTISPTPRRSVRIYSYCTIVIIIYPCLNDRLKC